MTTIAELRTVLTAAVAELSPAELPDLVGLLETVKIRALARVLSPAAPVATDDVVDVATLSAELHLAPSWLRAKARDGTLPHVRCGKYIKFRRAQVIEALSRPGTDHRMASPVAAEKPSNGAAPFPSVSTRKAAAHAD
jgi:hypothetical protein